MPGVGIAPAGYSQSYVAPVTDAASSQASYAWQQQVFAQPDVFPQYYAGQTLGPVGDAGQYMQPVPSTWTSESAPYPVSLPAANPVDFILGDTWSNFMEHYGRVGH